MSSTASASSFKDEIRENPFVHGAPEIMSTRPALQPEVPHLTGDDAKEAISSLYNKTFLNLKFPKVQRFRVDPPSNQQNYYALHSFIPAPGATPDKDGCFGVMKIRGAFGNLDEADAWAEHLIRNVDSSSEIHIGYVGKEFPLTLDPLYFNETHEIDMKKKMDETARSHAKSVREKEEQDMRLIKQRETELLQSSKMTAEEINASIDHYIAMKVKCANILYVRDETLKKLEAYENTRQETLKELAEIEQQSPEYKEQYMEKFMKSLSDIGVTDSPLLKYM